MQVVEIRNEESGELVQFYRIKGNKVQPKLFEAGTFSLTVGEDDVKQKFEKLKTQKHLNSNKIFVEL